MNEYQETLGVKPILPDDTNVEVVFANGETDSFGRVKDWEWNWIDFEPSGYDVVKYRIL